jgi:hypothetical protein
MSAHGDSGDEEVMFKDQEVEEVSEASQAEIENLLNEVNGMSPETLNVYLEQKEKIQMDKIKMELEKEQMHQRS